MSILTEAFRKLNILDEETFPVSNKGIQEMKDFIEDEGDALKKLEVIDQETESEDDLQDSYEGKVIINCDVCHSDVFEDPSNIEIEDDKTKIEHECPYCHTTNEFTIKGQVVPFEVKDEVEEEDDEDEVKVEVEEKDESLNEADEGVTLGWALEKNKNKLSSFTSKEELIDFVKSLEPKVRDKDYLKKTLEVLKGKNFLKAYQHLYDIILKNDGMGSIERKTVQMNKDRKAESMNEDKQAANVLDKYQEWVDYDMKKYHRISDVTKNKLAKAGFEVVKDDHGDYEVVAKDKKELGESRLDELFGFGKKKKAKETDDDSYEKEQEEKQKKFHDEQEKSRFQNYANLANKEAERNKKKREEEERSYNSSTWHNSDSRFQGTGSDLYHRYHDSSESLGEALENVQIETENERITVSSERKEPEFDETESVSVDTLEPVSKETEEEILDNNDLVDEDEEGEEETTDEEVAEFEESYFNQLGTSYLRENYNNVKSFETSKVKEYKNGFILEGIINFRSGAKKNTKFVFEAKTISKSGRAKFLGENVDMKTGKDSFTLRANLKNKKLLPESLTYNYKSKDPDTGKSVQIYGKSKIR